MRRRAFVALLAGAGGVRAAVPEPEGYRLDDYRAPVPGTVAGAPVLDAAAVHALTDTVLVDVLPAPRRPEAMRPGVPWLPLPHLSLPGALWWPEVGRGVLPPGMEARFAVRLREVTDGGKRAVFFCLPECWMSWNATRRAVSLGVPAAWFPGGTVGWTQAGYALVPVAAEELG